MIWVIMGVVFSECSSRCSKFSYASPAHTHILLTSEFSSLWLVSILSQLMLQHMLATDLQMQCEHFHIWLHFACHLNHIFKLFSVVIHPANNIAQYCHRDHLRTLGPWRVKSEPWSFNPSSLVHWLHCCIVPCVWGESWHSFVTQHSSIGDTAVLH